MITQLNPPLPLHTPKGDGLAHFVIDYGPETDLLWIVFMDKDGACWSVPNPEVRMRTNWSMGRRRGEDDKEKESAETARPAAPVYRAFPRASET
jgi:hypothetical protein